LANFLSDKLKATLVEKGPPSPIDNTFIFPLVNKNSRFTVFNYQRVTEKMFQEHGLCIPYPRMLFSAITVNLFQLPKLN